MELILLSGLINFLSFISFNLNSFLCGLIVPLRSQFYSCDSALIVSSCLGSVDYLIFLNNEIYFLHMSFCTYALWACLVWRGTRNSGSGKTHFPLPVFVWNRKREMGKPPFPFSFSSTPSFYTTIFLLVGCYS